MLLLLTKFIQETAQVCDESSTNDELVPDVGVHHEIKVALTKPLFLVLEAKMQVGKHVQAWS